MLSNGLLMIMNKIMNQIPYFIEINNLIIYRFVYKIYIKSSKVIKESYIFVILMVIIKNLTIILKIIDEHFGFKRKVFIQYSIRSFLNIFRNIRKNNQSKKQ